MNEYLQWQNREALKAVVTFQVKEKQVNIPDCLVLTCGLHHKTTLTFPDDPSALSLLKTCLTVCPVMN